MLYNGIDLHVYFKRALHTSELSKYFKHHGDFRIDDRSERFGQLLAHPSIQIGVPKSTNNPNVIGLWAQLPPGK